jgi:dipeptidyl aminopeptidase/acylaminoacyl peptidase
VSRVREAPTTIKILLIAIVLILLPGAVLSYVSYISVNERAGRLEAGYRGTLYMVRDKIELEVLRVEQGLRSSLGDAGTNLNGLSAARHLLSLVTANHPHGGYPVQPRWSPDGKRIFHVNNQGNASGDWQELGIAYVPAEGGDVTRIPLHSEVKIRLQGYVTGNRVSPDGRTIVFAGHKSQAPIDTMHIWTLAVDGGTPRQLTDAPAPFSDSDPCWSPDGQNIAFVRTTAPENWGVVGKANIYIVPAAGGEPRQITSERDRVFGPVLWSPDGKLLAHFSRDKDDATDGTLKVIPVNGGEPQAVAKVQGIYANKEMAWSWRWPGILDYGEFPAARENPEVVWVVS